MKVHVPSPLRSYTKDCALVEAGGSTLGGVLLDLERQFPGIRFRMIDEQDRVRQHIKLFVDQELTVDLEQALKGGEEIHVICAISGG